MDHEKYEQRMDFVRSVLQKNKLKATKIETVEYDPNTPHHYNNFIYLVTLTLQSRPVVVSSQYGTSPIPAGTTFLIFRLSNDHPGTDLNNANRVENEVAFMSLVRKALSGTKYSQIVPEIYSWASVSSGQGFTMQQRMPGVMPDKVFNDLSIDDKIVVRSQMADILGLIQRFHLPDTIRSYGGLTFDPDGNVVSAQMTLLKGGPFESYEDLVKFMFQSQLKEAEGSAVIEGWNPNGVRHRIDNFIERRLGKVFLDLDSRKVLVHSDFTTNNFLFDTHTLHITAILDFDFSCIATAAHEFAGFSFTDVPGGKIPGLFDSSQISLRNAILAGFPDDMLPPVEENALFKWQEAKAWYSDLARSGALAPHNVTSFDRISNAFWLNDCLCPFLLTNDFLMKRRTTEQLAELRKEKEQIILKLLESEGF